MFFTPASAHALTSFSRMGREEFAMSIVPSPTPLQNCFRPAEEPPDSTTGALNFE
jgi:hypothetical protein